MFKPLQIQIEQIGQPRSLDESIARKVFQVLHGYYGALFLSKFSTGAAVNGEDQGIANARKTWAWRLSRYDVECIKSALELCQRVHEEFPPSLPQFVSLCEANRARAVDLPTDRIAMSGELRSQYASRARAIVAKHAEKALQNQTGYEPLPPTLDGLKRAIASAVCTAGGDEAATLLRLDRMFRKEAV